MLENLSWIILGTKKIGFDGNKQQKRKEKQEHSLLILMFVREEKHLSSLGPSVASKRSTRFLNQTLISSSKRKIQKRSDCAITANNETTGRNATVNQYSFKSSDENLVISRKWGVLNFPSINLLQTTLVWFLRILWTHCICFERDEHFSSRGAHQLASYTSKLDKINKTKRAPG